MPIRAKCPGCSRHLNLGDELAGRKVRCPACKTTFNVPKPDEPEELLEPEQLVTAEEPPSRRPSRNSVARHEEPEDTDSDEGDEPDEQEKKPTKKKGSWVPMLLLGCGGLLFVCCGGGGVSAYMFWPVPKPRNNSNSPKVETNPRVTLANFKRLNKGMTQAQVEEILGPGRVATIDDLKLVLKQYPPAWIAEHEKKWTPTLTKKNAYAWRNGDMVILVSYTVSPAAGGRLQKYITMEMVDGFRPMLHDLGNFFDDGKGPEEKRDTKFRLRVEELFKEFKANKTAAEGKYKDAWIEVEGIVRALDIPPSGPPMLRLRGASDNGEQVRCYVDTKLRIAGDVTPGQKVTMKGKFAAVFGQFADLTDCTVVSKGPDPAVTVTSTTLIKAYSGDTAAADKMYKGKQVSVRGTAAERTAQGQLIIKQRKSKTKSLQIVVTFTPDWKSRVAAVRVPGLVKIKGECTGRSEDTIYINAAWLIP